MTEDNKTSSSHSVLSALGFTEDSRQQVEHFLSSHKAKVFTILMTDLEGSTQQQSELGNLGAFRITREHRRLFRELLARFDGLEVETAGDAFLVVFDSPSEGTHFALEMQVAMRKAVASGTPLPGVRVGLHQGQVVVERHDGDSGTGAPGKSLDIYGIQVSVAARITDLALGGQILLSRHVFDDARAILRDEQLGDLQQVLWRNHGPYGFKGESDTYEVCEVGEKDFAPMTAPLKSSKGWPEPGNSEPSDFLGGTFRQILVTVTVLVLLVAIAAAVRFSIPATDAEDLYLRAAAQLDRGGYSEAEALYVDYLELRPDDVMGHYGRGYALVRSGELAAAAVAFENIEQPEYRLEGLAAIALKQGKLDEARTLIEAKPEGAGPYFEILEARLFLSKDDFQASIDLLKEQQADDFQFNWQYQDALYTLGLAYDGLHSQDGNGVFAALAESANPEYAAIGKDFQAIATRRESLAEQRSLRDEIAVRLKKLGSTIDSSTIVPLTAEEKWTTRPIYFTINAGKGTGGPIAAMNGLTERIPLWLERSLIENTPMVAVSRDMLASMLQEQQLSKMLASEEGRLQLHQILAARIQITPEFITGGGESIVLSIVDNESSRKRLTNDIPLSPLGQAELRTALFDEVWDVVRAGYPLKGMLRLSSNGTPELSIGANVGVKVDMEFRLAMVPDILQVLGKGSFQVTSVESSTSKVALKGEGFTQEILAERGPFYAVEAAWYAEHYP